MPITSNTPEANGDVPQPGENDEATNDDVFRAARIANDTEEMRQVLRELFSWICIFVSTMWISVILLFLLFSMSGIVNFKHITILLASGGGGALTFAATYCQHVQENAGGVCQNYARVKHGGILKAVPASIAASIICAIGAWLLSPAGREHLYSGFDMAVFKWVFAASTASVLSVFGATMYWLFKDKAK